MATSPGIFGVADLRLQQDRPELTGPPEALAPQSTAAAGAAATLHKTRGGAMGEVSRRNGENQHVLQTPRLLQALSWLISVV